MILRSALGRTAVAMYVAAGSWLAVSAAYLGGLPTPACPTHAVLGLECPSCGATRAGAALLRGDVVAAADHNLLVLLSVPLFALWYLRSHLFRRSSWVTAGFARRLALSATVVFWMLRLLPVSSLGWFDAA